MVEITSTKRTRLCLKQTGFLEHHAMQYRNGGYVLRRHNRIRDMFSVMLNQVCHGVHTEPSLQPLTGVSLGDGARHPSLRLFCTMVFFDGFLIHSPDHTWTIHAFYFISNTFISNARLKFANFQKLSRKILRTELLNLCQMIALFPNSILNTFLSGRVRQILGNFGFH